MKQNTNLAAADQAYIATRNPKIYSFDTPSFSPYWTGRTHTSKKTYKSATITSVNLWFAATKVTVNNNIVISKNTFFLLIYQYILGKNNKN